mgnify:FL=1
MSDNFNIQDWRWVQLLSEEDHNEDMSLNERTEAPQDPDIKSKPGTQPSKYYKGLSKSTKEKRASQFKKQTAKSI